MEAALAVAGGFGFAALSTREISTALGVSPMAIYRHVTSMEDLRAEVADLALAEVIVPAPDLPPRRRLRDLVTDLHRVCRRYDGLSITMSQGPSRRAIEDALRSALQDTGLAAGDRETHRRMLIAVVIGVRELEHADDGRGQAAFDEVLELALASLARDGHGPVP